MAIQSICSADQDPLRFDGLDLTFETAGPGAGADGGGSRPAVCVVQSTNFGASIDCAAQTPCSVKVTEVP